MKSILACTRLAGIAAMFALAGGCANQNSIFRYKRVHGSQPVIVTEDAKQRNMVMLPDTKGGTKWRVCAEASPDVFSALSTSASADLGFGQSGGQTDAQAKAALAIAEAAGTIERTQTINMLRESMYRTCERYMSGAVDKATFVVQAGRDWRAMIAILAIEQLTRTARPPSTIISAGSTSATVEGVGDAARQLAAAQGRAGAATRRQREAQDGPPIPCPLPATPAPADADKAACDAKLSAIARANADLDQANADVATWRSVLESGVTERSAASTGVGTNDAGGVTTQPTNTTTEVAYVVGDIVRRAFETDETQLFCLQVLTPLSGLQIEEKLKNRCTDYLLAKVESEGARLLERADLRSRGFEEAVDTRRATTEMLAYLKSLTPAQYAAEAVAIRTVIPTFCRRAASLGQCIDNVAEGSLEGISPDVVRQALQTRRQQGGQW